MARLLAQKSCDLLAGWRVHFCNGWAQLAVTFIFMRHRNLFNQANLKIVPDLNPSSFFVRFHALLCCVKPGYKPSFQSPLSTFDFTLWLKYCFTNGNVLVNDAPRTWWEGKENMLGVTWIKGVWARCMQCTCGGSGFNVVKRMQSANTCVHVDLDES